MVVRGHADGAMDVINLKIGKVGGLTRARQIRDFCVAMGIAMTIEDSWGGDVVTAAIAHLAHSTPPEFLFSATDFNSYVTRSVAPDTPRRQGGRLAAGTKPGLGVTPDVSRSAVLPSASSLGRAARCSHRQDLAVGRHTLRIQREDHVTTRGARLALAGACT